MNDPLVVLRSKFGPSRLAPFIPGERPAERHRRRYNAAVANVEAVRAWCEYRGVVLRFGAAMHPDTHRPADLWKWDFRRPDAFAQWRPFAGKLNLKVGLRTGPMHVVKVYDTEQLLVALEWWLEEARRP